MMRAYRPTHHAAASAHSDAPPRTVYALLTDGSTWPSWIDVDSMALEREGSDGGETIGAIRAFRFRRAGVTLTTHERIVELVPDRRFSYALVSGLPLVNYRADVDLVPAVDGGTQIRWSGSWQAGVPGTGPLTRLLVARLYRQFSRGLARMAERA